MAKKKHNYRIYIRGHGDKKGLSCIFPDNIPRKIKKQKRSYRITEDGIEVRIDGKIIRNVPCRNYMKLALVTWDIGIHKNKYDKIPFLIRGSDGEEIKLSGFHLSLLNGVKVTLAEMAIYDAIHHIMVDGYEYEEGANELVDYGVELLTDMKLCGGVK